MYPLEYLAYPPSRTRRIPWLLAPPLLLPPRIIFIYALSFFSQSFHFSLIVANFLCLFWKSCFPSFCSSPFDPGAPLVFPSPLCFASPRCVLVAQQNMTLPPTSISTLLPGPKHLYTARHKAGASLHPLYRPAHVCHATDQPPKLSRWSCPTLAPPSAQNVKSMVAGLVRIHGSHDS